MSRSFEDYQREKREREWTQKVTKQKEGMGNAERVKKATDWKRIGNEKFKAGNFWEAQDYYREAIVYVEDLVDARRKERNDLLMPLYTNLAHVHLRLDEAEQAEAVCTKALALADIQRNAIPSGLRAKAQFRRGMARKVLGRLEEAQEDLVAAIKLQPENEEVARELAAVRAVVATEAQRVRAVTAGFLNRGSSEREERELKRKQEAEKRRMAEERRKERRARAEQRQQMQGAFEKLSKGKMLYEEREKEMGPVREKEKEKEQTLELERDLLNIIDDSKGLPKTNNMEEFMKKKEAQCEDQGAELNQKKKVLDKLKKEEVWEQDDVWKGQRQCHREQLESRRVSGETEQPKTLWESKEVARWCEQRLRDMLLCTFVEGPELPADLACAVVGKDNSGAGYVIKALITDVLKLTGDAAVMRLNTHKPPLFYYDYFVKLEWEVTVCRPSQRVYRSADELISVAAKIDDGKAPPSVTENRLCAGTFKIREFCSEEEPPPGETWKLAAKVKKPCDKHTELTSGAEELRDRLRGKVERLLSRWADEYRAHWG
eukprot:TRINITY_DN54533_c0_g1_i1.p1 TRINITY_DN54533_c0_g1~~TRINITY_DN54533_c0_g1_i1.p1  ORF type:complete len:546 (-),score=141.14 TRINITY_DN54533_c0_g1_i1:148-1785(-)